MKKSGSIKIAGGGSHHSGMATGQTGVKQEGLGKKASRPAEQKPLMLLDRPASGKGNVGRSEKGSRNHQIGTGRIPSLDHPGQKFREGEFSHRADIGPRGFDMSDPLIPGTVEPTGEHQRNSVKPACAFP